MNNFRSTEGRYLGRRFMGGGALKAAGMTVQLLHEHIGNTDQVITVNRVIETLGKKRRLTKISAFDVTRHASP